MIGEDRDGRVERIPLGRIRPRAFAVRNDHADGLERLAASIRSLGLLHPLVLRPRDGGFEVVCGQRRLEAIRALGWGEVPAIVRELDDRRALELTIAENVRRAPYGEADRQGLLDQLREAFPGRRPEELESWLGTIVPALPLPSWLDPSETIAPAREPEAPPPLPEPAPFFEPERPAIAEAEPEPEFPLPDPVPEAFLPGTEDAPPPFVDSPTEILSPDPDEPPPAEAIPELRGDTTVIVPAAGMTLRKRGVVARTRTLINKLSKSGILDEELLEDIVDDLLKRLDEQPAADFLDLRYPPRAKRWLSRHTVNVTKLAIYLARALQMTPEEVREVAYCGLLHDIGMSKIKDDVFTKHAALDQAEWDQVKGHPIEGALLLTKEVLLRDVVARVALEHHEKPDGSGYPSGKKREETHLYARLINVVDTYGAMVSPRAHRLPLIPYDAMRIVMDDGAKGMLDWDLVQAFVRAMSIYPVGSYVRLDGGEIARVVRAQADIPEKPVIAVVADAQRNMLQTPVEIDLAMTEPMPRIEPIPAPS